MSFGFKTQLTIGQLGEALFLDANKDTLIKTSGRKGDFINRQTGQRVELKSDYYPAEKTPNFFFERYSDAEKQTPGGPWQALKNETPVFVYFYPLSLVYFTFDTQKLIDALEPMIQTMEPKMIQNRDYQTAGYAVPRQWLNKLYKETKLTIERKKDVA